MHVVCINKNSQSLFYMPSEQEFQSLLRCHLLKIYWSDEACIENDVSLNGQRICCTFAVAEHKVHSVAHSCIQSRAAISEGIMRMLMTSMMDEESSLLVCKVACV